MTAQVRGSRIDRSTVQELGGLELGDLRKSWGEERQASPGARLERPIMQVRLDQIAGDSPFQSRGTTFDPTAYPEDAELLASIRECGVLEPIMLVRNGDSRELRTYNIVFGHRRRAAAQVAGQETIPAIIARSGDDLGILTLAENTGGRKLSSYERAIALTKLKQERPSLTQVVLAEKMGVSQGTVSNLLAAYQGSTPALRGLFAEGMDARAVVELQETFAGLEEKEQVKLAEELSGASQQTVRGVKDLVRSGVRPRSAAAAVGARGRTAAARDVLDGNQLRALAEHTRVPLQSVKNLAGKARAMGAGLEALRLACVYLAHGGSERNPLGTAAEVATDGKADRLVVSRLQLDRKARALIETTHGAQAREFLTTVFFGGAADGRPR